MRDIEPGQGGSAAGEFFELRGRLCFLARDTEDGLELWTSDGTAAGTLPLVDICPGACDGVLGRSGRTGERVVFAASDGVHGLEPWVTDGTAAGTRMLADLRPGPESSNPDLFAPLDDGRLLLYVAGPDRSEQLWTTDGSPEGTRPLLRRDSRRPEMFNPFWCSSGGRLFVELWDESWTGDVPGNQLWLIEGAAGTLSLVMNGARLNGSTCRGGVVYFSATTPGRGLELWHSDGSARGTWSFGVPVPYGATFQTAAAGELVFFGAGKAPEEVQLWRTDGRMLGTRLVTTRHPGPGFALGDQLFVRDLVQGDGQRLWVVTGAQTEPRVLTGQGMQPDGLFSDGGALYFWARDAEHGRELWTSDGTEQGTRLAVETTPGPLGNGGRPGFRLGDRLFFSADGGDGCGEELWAWRTP